MSNLARIQYLGIKSEPVQGSDATIGNTDYLLVENLDVKAGREQIERNYKRSTLGTIESSNGKKWVEINFTTPLYGSGSYLPQTIAILEACGYSASYDAGEVTVNPISTSLTNFLSPAKTATVVVYKDGIKHQASGCVGTFKINMEAGKPATLEVSMKGCQSSAVGAFQSTASNPTPTLNTSTKPPLVAQAGLMIGSYSPVGVTKIGIDAGVDVQQIDDVNAIAGVGGFIVADRKPTGTIDPIAPILTSLAPINTMLSDVTGTAVFNTHCTIGAATGNKVTLTMANSQWSDVQYAERNGFTTYNGTLRFNDSATGNDAIVFTFE